MKKTFAETEHPRAESGEFRDKTQSTPELSPLTSADTRSSNFTRSEKTANALWHFNDSDQLHRTNGPAVEFDEGHDHYGQGRYFYYLDGVEVFPPDDTGFDLSNVTDSGEQIWTSGGGNRIVFVKPTGETIFTRDGDIHRDGGPAIITPAGESWYRAGRRIDNPIPPAPAVFIDESTDSTITTGSRYVESASTDTVARALRKDIDQMIDAGVLSTLGGIEYTVAHRKNRSQDRPEITVTVIGMHRDDVIRDNDQSDGPLHTDEATEMLRILRSLGQARNKVTAHNGTDSIKSPFWFDATITTAR